jgi:hypothetical protein
VAAVTTENLLEMEVPYEEVRQGCEEEGLFRNNPSQRLMESIPTLLSQDELVMKVVDALNNYKSREKDPTQKKSKP